LISDFGTLGVQKLDAAQACKAKEKEISDLLAAHQKELNELSANLQRLENEHGVVLAKLQDNGIKIDGLQKP
jgi:ABC-type Fe3+-citrate transport system substrate-binding protein